MSLENIKGKMNRNEMRNIMAGSGNDACNRPGFPCNAACYTASISNGICRVRSGGCQCTPV